MKLIIAKYCGILGMPHRKQPYLPSPSPPPPQQLSLVVILGSGYLARETARPVV